MKTQATLKYYFSMVLGGIWSWLVYGPDWKLGKCEKSCGNALKNCEIGDKTYAEHKYFCSI